MRLGAKHEKLLDRAAPELIQDRLGSHDRIRGSMSAVAGDFYICQLKRSIAEAAEIGREQGLR